MTFPLPDPVVVDDYSVQRNFDMLARGLGELRDTYLFGVGVPTATVAAPALYVRRDAVSASTVLYVNPGGATWTAVVVP